MAQQQIHVPEKIIYTREDGIRDIFIRHEKLGQGGFAVVHRVTHQNTNKTYAMKIISKERYENPKNKALLDKLKNEIQIQKDLNHPNIVRSKFSFSDEYNQYIVLEYCPGKTIRDYIRKSEHGYLSEPETRRILNDILQGLVYLHNRRIIHHDLKLENFLIGSDGRVKIADFGVSVVLHDSNEKNNSFCGTSNYLSPEILLKENKEHSFEVDIWAIGVSAFIMLTGQPPFCGFEKEFVYEKIKNSEYYFPPTIPISKEAKHFIKKILQIDPRKRPTAIELVDHPFLTKFDKEQIQLYKPIQNSKGAVSQKKFIPSTNNALLLRRQASSPLRSNAQNILRTPNINETYRNSVEIVYPLKKLVLNRSLQISIENDQQNNIINNSNAKKRFTIPNHFVVKFYFVVNDLGYLLGDGTVGVCFEDGSRIVLDPLEKFVQYYLNVNSCADVINLNQINYINIKNDSIENKLYYKISLVQKFAVSFKKFQNLYELNNCNYDSFVPLYQVKYFLKKSDSILFKLNDNNIQINFNDRKKLIIFSSLRKMSLVSHLKERCNFIDLKDIVNMDSECEEFIKFSNAKEMINEIPQKNIEL